MLREKLLLIPSENHIFPSCVLDIYAFHATCITRIRHLEIKTTADSQLKWPINMHENVTCQAKLLQSLMVHQSFESWLNLLIISKSAIICYSCTSSCHKCFGYVLRSKALLFRDSACLRWRKCDVLRMAPYGRQGLGPTRFLDLQIFRWSSMSIFFRKLQTTWLFILRRYFTHFRAHILRVLYFQMMIDWSTATNLLTHP